MSITNFSEVPAIYAVDRYGSLIARTKSLAEPEWVKIIDADDFAADFRISAFIIDPGMPMNAAYVAGYVGAVPYLYYLNDMAEEAGSQIITELWNGTALSAVTLYGFELAASVMVDGAVYGVLTYDTSSTSYQKLLKRTNRVSSFSLVTVNSAVTGSETYEAPSIDIGKHSRNAATTKVAIAGAEGKVMESTDGGSTFTVVRNTGTATFNYTGVHYPYDDNPDDEILIVGTEQGIGAKLYIRENSVWGEITPNALVSGDYVGLARGNRAIYTYKKGREFLSTIGLSGDTPILNASLDAGSTWDNTGLAGDMGVVPLYTTYEKGTLRDSFVHNFNSGTTEGSYTLISGNPYIIRLVGWGGYAEAGSNWGETDAAYYWYGNTATPTSPNGPTGSIVNFNGTLASPTNLIDPAYNDAHDYEFLHTGTGARLIIGFDTGHPVDNHGSWTVQVYDAVPVTIYGNDNRFYTAEADSYGFEPDQDGTSPRAVFVSGCGFTDTWEILGSAGNGIHIKYNFGSKVKLTSVKVDFKTRFVGTNPKVTATLDGNVFGTPPTGSMPSALFTGNAIGSILKIVADPNDGGSEDTDNCIMRVKMEFEYLDDVAGVDGWPYDPDILWLSGSWIFNGDKGIFWTDDYGNTWNNMIGDWETAIGDFKGIADLVPIGYFMSEPLHEGPIFWPINFAGSDDSTGRSGLSISKGEKRLQLTDLMINSSPEPLNFTRIYRQSKQDEFQFMGLGWTHNHHMTMTKLGGSPEKLLVLLPSGGTAQFTEVSTNSYQGDPGSNSTMTYDSGDDQFVLVAEDRSEFHFEPTIEASATVYRLFQRRWNTGEIWAYTYETGSDLLSTVDDGQGRSLTFSYDENDQLERVTDHVDRYVALTYVEVNSQLLLSEVSDVLNS